jgi:hypothetical protein
MSYPRTIPHCRLCTAPHHARGLCKTHYDRCNNRGVWTDDTLPTLPPPGFAPRLRAHPDQPAIDPALTPAKVWEIAHRNAVAATHWLVNTGRMTPDEAAALVMLTYAPPTNTAQVAA